MAKTRHKTRVSRLVRRVRIERGLLNADRGKALRLPNSNGSSNHPTFWFRGRRAQVTVDIRRQIAAEIRLKLLEHRPDLAGRPDHRPAHRGRKPSQPEEVPPCS